MTPPRIARLPTRRFAFAYLLLPCVLACDPPDAESESTATLSHARDIQPIWSASCTTDCHEPGGEWEFMDLSEGPSYDALVEVLAAQVPEMSLIEPWEPDASYVWHKLNGTQAVVGGSGEGMPKDAPPLSSGELELIEAWILPGAPP